MLTTKNSSINSSNIFSRNNTHIYKLFNFRLYECNQNKKNFSTKNSTKFNLNNNENIYFNQDSNKNSLITIEHCTKEKNKNNNNNIFTLKNRALNHQILFIKRPHTKKHFDNNAYLNLALIPLKYKKSKSTLNNKDKFLNNGNIKIDMNNFSKFKYDFPQKEINNNDKYLTEDFVEINKENNPDDDYSDCKSLKGIILSIKRKIMENRYKVNKTFNDFDKQILQDQYLIERFYEMKKSVPNKRKKNIFRNNMKKRLFHQNNKKEINFKFNNKNK